MAKTTSDVIITEICKRVGFDVTAAGQPRADALTHLNRAEKYINQRYSLLSLVFTTPVTLNNNASSVALPTTIDYGKTFAIQKSTGDGELIYVPPDEWHLVGEDTYGDWESNRPSRFTLLTDGAGVMSIYFKPTNTTGGNITFNLIGQKVVIPLIDNSVGAGSTSLLPEGWEDTILLERAETTLKRILRRAGWQDLKTTNDADIEAFYSSYRMTKEKPTTDREQQERKIARDQLADGV